MTTTQKRKKKCISSLLGNVCSINYYNNITAYSQGYLYDQMTLQSISSIYNV